MRCPGCGTRPKWTHGPSFEGDPDDPYWCNDCLHVRVVWAYNEELLMVTSVEVGDLEAQKLEDCPMNQYNHYMIVPEGKQKQIGHVRVSTFKDAAESRYNLEKYGKRIVAKGVAGNDQLRMAIAATTLEEKGKLNDFCEEAFEKAGGNDKSRLGTALHRFAERRDQGDEVAVPQPFDADIAAYEYTMKAAGTRIIEIEQVLVLPQYTVAGRFDRILDFGEGSEAFLADIKTGADLEYSWQGISIQLALYAHAETIYDPKTQKHRPMPKVRQDKAMVIHVPAGYGTCTLYWVKIEPGWAMVPHCAEIRKWHKVRGLNEKVSLPVDDKNEDQILVDLLKRRQGLTERITKLKGELPQALAVLAQRWPMGVPTFKQTDTHSDGELSAIDGVLSAVEAEFEAPF